MILPFLPLRLLWKARKNAAYRWRILERFSFFNFPKLSASIWIHAVSVGEVMSAVPLINSLIAGYPNFVIVVTTMTPTGAERIKEIFGEKVRQLYVPYDYPFAVKKFLRQIKPKILVIMETELWPNIMHYSNKYGIPIVLANACLSEKSFRGYQKFSLLLRDTINCITKIAAQTQLDADRFLALGADQKKILIASNVKFDIVIPANILEDSKKLRGILGQDRPIWIAASTHEGEEEKILRAAKIVLESIPDSLLILVPRHMERFQKVFNLCYREGFEVVYYSEKQKYSASCNVILGDIMGQLLLFYAISDVAFVGGSLVPWGGHNLLEPAMLEKPVLAGNSLEEFAEIRDLFLDANALIIADDENILAENIVSLLQDKSKREKMGSAAFSVVNKNRGATQKILNLIHELM
jgi:3-deoxy-D-manno-octulosonic-acid transferase